jgi:hypothetical protein
MSIETVGEQAVWTDEWSAFVGAVVVRPAPSGLGGAWCGIGEREGFGGFGSSGGSGFAVGGVRGLEAFEDRLERG